MSGLPKQVEAIVASKLAEELSERIRREGKITLRDWMHTALYHPTLGYYSRADLKRWGREGDYRTSPERSELFAATFARYFVSLYQRMESPSEFIIVEMGAGNGQFAAGVLEMFETTFPSVFSATRYLVAETSVDSRLRAAVELERFRDRVQFVRFEDLGTLRSGVVFSNELLDAFPVHRVTKIKGQVKELFVTLTSDSAFGWLAGDPSSEDLNEFCQQHVPHLEEGQIVEVNLGIKDWFQVLDEKLKTGYLITVDYGAESKELYSSSERYKGTLRAFRRHEFVDDILEAPGEYDITSSVDWTYVMTEGRQRGFELEEFIPLDKFLMRAGVLEELESRLAAATSDAERSCLTTKAREMILPGGMASSFQVLIQKR